jgi:hypothetical protein
MTFSLRQGSQPGWRSAKQQVPGSETYGWTSNRR